MKKLLSLASIISIISLVGCSSTPKVENNWVAPEVGSIKFSKVMVVAATPDGALRRNAEDAIAKVIPPKVETVTSYSTLEDAESLKSAKAVTDAAAAAGVDGIIVMRPLGKNTEVNYMPGTNYPEPYWNFTGYYRPSWGLSAYYDPGYITTDTTVGIETNIYDAESGDLIWSGSVKIMNPDNLTELINENAIAVLAKLKEQQLIPM